MSEARETRPVSEVRAEKKFQAKFKRDVRTHGKHKAVENMEAMNARQRAADKRDRDNELEGRASNVMLGGAKFGWGTHVPKNAGTRTKTTYRGGDKIEQVWKDGELVSEKITSIK